MSAQPRAAVLTHVVALPLGAPHRVAVSGPRPRRAVGGVGAFDGRFSKSSTLKMSKRVSDAGVMACLHLKMPLERLKGRGSGAQGC